MIKAEEAREGRVVMVDGKLYRVLNLEFGGAAKAGRIVHLKIQNIENQSITQATFHGNDLIEEITLDKYPMEYIYNDGLNYYFMNKETYEQFAVPSSVVGGISQYLKENTEIMVEFYDGKPVNIDFPKTITLKVESTASAIHEGSSGAPFKSATLENNMEILVPQFIKEGDVIIVDTASGKYVDRVKKM
ncbi:MAG: elongation factor P [bacterium]